MIDGDTLKLLVKDLEEFCLLIPQSGMRVKLKAVIQNYETNSCEDTCSPGESLVSLRTVYNYIEL